MNSENHKSTPKLIVITGGPGAGKTAILEMARRLLCPQHVEIIPEAASIIFGGGFVRRPTVSGRCAAQRAIYYVQREMERMVLEAKECHVALCDRGTLDGLAYWPSDPSTWWSEVRTSLEAELARYAAVIHLNSPDATHGYNHQNNLRTETPSEAKAIDELILKVWSAHPKRYVIESSNNFFEKAEKALYALSELIPQCTSST